MGTRKGQGGRRTSLRIERLPADRWRDYRDLRFEALESDPRAFGGSREDSEKLSEDDWRNRMANALFAMVGDEPVGMIVVSFNDRVKTRHIAEIFGVYVARRYRGKGIGTKLLAQALRVIQERGGILKVELAVNPEQRVALRLYEGAGFVVAGRLRKELKVGRRFFDELMMERLF